MRANKDERKPEPHTLIKFANPYFKDTSSVGPPDNDDTRIKRQSCQVGGYQVSKFFTAPVTGHPQETEKVSIDSNCLLPMEKREIQEFLAIEYMPSEESAYDPENSIEESIPKLEVSVEIR
ncbi:hypothetical protein ACROYT_G015190 [Oculina patagonica]